MNMDNICPRCEGVLVVESFPYVSLKAHRWSMVCNNCKFKTSESVSDELLASAYNKDDFKDLVLKSLLYRFKIEMEAFFDLPNV